MEQVDSLKTDKKFKKTEIGEIPVDWEIVKLKDIAEIGSGDSAPQGAKYFENGEYLFIRTSDVGQVRRSHCFGISVDKVNDLAVQKFGLRQWPKGTILFPKSGASTFLNHRVLLSRPACVSSHLATIVAKNQAVAEFLYYYLLTIDARSLVPASNYPSLRLGDLATLSVPLPLLSEQKKIAEILSTVDEAIEKSDEIIEKTKELKKGLMQELLTRGIGHTKFKKTEIGEIPVDWKVVKLKEIAEIGSGDSAPQGIKYFANGEYLFIRTSDVGQVRRSHCFGISVDKVNDLAVQKFGLHQWHKGTILFPKSGASTFLNHRVLLSRPAYVSSHLGTIVAKNQAVAEFLYYYLLTIDAKSLVPASNYPSLRLGDLATLSVPFPSFPEQKKIAEILTTVDEEIEKESAHKNELESIKKGLMQILLTGKKRVKA